MIWWPIERSTAHGFSGALVRFVTFALAWKPVLHVLSSFQATSTPLVTGTADIELGAINPSAATAVTVIAAVMDVFRMVPP